MSAAGEIPVEVLAQYIWDRLELAWPEHRTHYKPRRKCPWCIIQNRVPIDLRNDAEVLIANAGALS